MPESLPTLAELGIGLAGFSSIVIAIGGSTVSLAAMLCNAIGRPFPPSPTAYVYCLTYLLFYGGVQFIRLLTVRPSGPQDA